MPAPAIFAKVGAVIGKAVAGTAKGIAAAAKGTAKVTAKGAKGAKSGAKSGGKLTKSSTKVKNNITKSNKRISKIKKNRQRIKKAIKNEQDRLQNERNLERKRTSNKVPGSGILNSPVISGLRKFIYTLLFGLAITNIEKIMESLEKVKKMIAGFVKFIVNIKDGISNIISAFQSDNDRLEKEKEDFDSALGKMKSALETIDADDLNKKVKDVDKKLSLKQVGQGVGHINESGTDIVMEGSGKRWQEMNLEELLLAIEKSKSEGGSRSERKEMQKRVIFLKWAKENNIDLNNLKIENIKNQFDLNDIELSKNNNLDGLNSSTDQNMVVVNKTIIKKEFVPVPYSA
tara:strand:- start:185 stop:1219 length:1035 start_codon:yes stop_codon:yes gene_type:complete